METTPLEQRRFILQLQHVSIALNCLVQGIWCISPGLATRSSFRYEQSVGRHVQVSLKLSVAHIQHSRRNVVSVRERQLFIKLLMRTTCVCLVRFNKI